MIERSASGIYRLPLWKGWAIGIDLAWPRPAWRLRRYHEGGWSFNLLWFHLGRKDRKTWSHRQCP